jgi:hypothetical protein
VILTNNKSCYWRLIVLFAVSVGWLAPVARADEALDTAIETLKSYDWGSDRAALQAIDRAVAAAHEDPAAGKQLETRLVELLKADPPQAAKDYLCRQLSLVGSAACVPAVASLLTDERMSHMARYALERISDDAAVAALREAMPKLEGDLKVGVINSLGVRRDTESTATLIGLLGDANERVAGAAAAALGDIGTIETAKALGEFQSKASEALKLVAADAYLACAEHLLADGKKLDAMKIYRQLAKPDQPKHVRLAATRGLLAVTQQK